MIDSLRSLLKEQIKDLYSAENQLIKALPKMAKAASNDSLREAFEGHLEETMQQVERLAEIAGMLEISPRGKKCHGMEGLLEEGKEAMEEEGEDASLDAGLIAAAQKVEHYEISAYTSACALAKRLDESEIATLLQETLDEEIAADEKLTGISQEEILPAASTDDEEAESSSSTVRSKKKTVGRRALASK